MIGMGKERNEIGKKGKKKEKLGGEEKDAGRGEMRRREKGMVWAMDVPGRGSKTESLELGSK